MRNPPRDAEKPRVILFDLGGVLVDWNGIEPLRRLTGGRLSAEGARRFWLESPWVRRFERGACSAFEFGAGVAEELRLSMEPAEFVDAFRDWDRGLLPGARELLDGLRGRFRLACLTNNNEIHWRKLVDTGVASRFERCYSSHLIGLVKPDRETFELVIRDLACAAKSILFLDDNPECVDAARAAGLTARLARGVEGAREALAEAGIGT